MDHWNYDDALGYYNPPLDHWDMLFLEVCFLCGCTDIDRLLESL